MEPDTYTAMSVDGINTSVCVVVYDRTPADVGLVGASRVAAVDAVLKQKVRTHHLHMGAPAGGSGEVEVGAMAGRLTRVAQPCGLLRGNAGSLKMLAPTPQPETFVLLPSDIGERLDVSAMVTRHHDSGSDLSVFQAGGMSSSRRPSVFVFGAEVLDFIPEQGYWDMQENLIPELLILGRRVRLEEMPARVSRACPEGMDPGPCELRRGAAAGQFDCTGWGEGKSDAIDGPAAAGAPSVVGNTTPSTGRVVLGRRVPLGLGFGLVAIAATCLWSYKDVIRDLWETWMRSDEYSAGLLVPLLAVYVLWSRRRDLRKVAVRADVIPGVLAVILSQAVRLFGLYAMYRSLERLSLVLCVWALALWLGGRRLVWHLGGVLLFLLLMLPWPGRAQAMISLPLQRWATTSAVFSLEAFGLPVIREGNVIQIGDTQVAVAEACNGLRMVTAFFVIGALVILLANRAWWEKLVLFLSCLPIALVCNTIRLTITSVAFTRISAQYWEKVFHDFGGYAMMPLALGLVVLELSLLDRMVVSADAQPRDVVVRDVSP